MPDFFHGFLISNTVFQHDFYFTQACLHGLVVCLFTLIIHDEENPGKPSRKMLIILQGTDWVSAECGMLSLSALIWYKSLPSALADLILTHIDTWFGCWSASWIMGYVEAKPKNSE